MSFAPKPQQKRTGTMIMHHARKHFHVHKAVPQYLHRKCHIAIRGVHCFQETAHVRSYKQLPFHNSARVHAAQQRCACWPHANLRRILAGRSNQCSLTLRLQFGDRGCNIMRFPSVGEAHVGIGDASAKVEHGLEQTRHARSSPLN